MYKDLIIDKLNSLGVKYVTSGDHYLLSQCLNPNHNDKKPSFSINTETGFCKCFGCGYTTNKDFFTGGIDDEDYLEELERASLYNKLKEEYSEEEEKKPVIYMPPVAERPTKAFRGLSVDLLNKAEIYITKVGRYADRTIFPFYEEGYVQGFTSRALGDEEPKYLHSKGFNAKRVVYPYDLVKASKTDTVLVVEGVMDCLSAWELGIPAICNFGVAFNFDNKKIAKLLSLGIENLIICLDRDKAGNLATFGVHEEGRKEVIGMLDNNLLLDNFNVTHAINYPALHYYYKDLDSKDLNDFLQNPMRAS